MSMETMNDNTKMQVQTGGEPPVVQKKKGTGAQRIAGRALVIFLAAMLAMTFISRAAFAMTTPIVTTQSPSQGPLTHQVEGSGLLEAEDVALVRPDAGMLIEKTEVSPGQKVKEGDVLARYSLGEIDKSIAQAQRDIEKLTIQKEQSALGIDPVSPLDPSIGVGVLRAQEDIRLTQEKAERALTQAEREITAAQSDLVRAKDDLERTIKEAGEGIRSSLGGAARITQEQLSAAREEARKATEDAYRAYEDQKNSGTATQSEIDRAFEDYEAAVKRGGELIEQAQAQHAEAADKYLQSDYQSTLGDAQVRGAENAVRAAEEALDAKRRVLDDTRIDNAGGQRSAQRGLEDASLREGTAQQSHREAQSRYGNSKKSKDLSQKSYQLDIDVQQEALSVLVNVRAQEGVLVAPMSGTVAEVRASVGSKTTGEPLFTIAKDEEGYRATMTIDGDNAKYVEIGDVAQYRLPSERAYSKGGVVESVRSTKEGVQVVVTLPKGTGALGMSAAIRISKATQSYQTRVPIGALGKSDNGMDCVYVLRERQGILGKENYAQQIAVSVLDRDNVSAGIEGGGLYREDMVIINSTKPVQDGGRVRPE